MKHQAPTSNIQRSTKLQAPSLRVDAGLEAWNLKFLWSLELGIWSFSS
jgi:hypothetical protein